MTNEPGAAARPMIDRSARRLRVHAHRLLADGQFSILLLGCLAGAAGGAVASLMSRATLVMHRLLFLVPDGERLSGAFSPANQTVFLALALGGLAVGVGEWLWKWKPTSEVADPIEANALFGGRMSIRGSLFVAWQSILSNGLGASVGLEGGFTQLASALGSWLGRVMKRSRDDMRILVACGAAGGIAGAFDAPFAGAAYGFELILASYSPNILAPVVLSALSGKYAAALTAAHGYHLTIGGVFSNVALPVSLTVSVGVACGLLAILLMRGVTLVERAASATRLPRPLRTMAGGILVAGLALLSPHVLGAGHGGIDEIFVAPGSAPLLAAVLLLKIAACMLSIGSGFRGGLFSASLYLGTLVGGTAGVLLVGLNLLDPDQLATVMVVAMSSFAAAVVGTPLAMAILAAEVTGRIEFMPGMLLAVVAATIVVRGLFGYSFSTWRLHVRGSPARSAGDIAWARAIPIAEIMRPDVHKLPDTVSCEELLRRFPPGSAKRVVLVDGEDRYRGLCDVAEIAFNVTDRSVPALAYARQQEEVLTLAQSLDDALHWVERLGREAVVVVYDEKDRRIAGLVTDAYVLKRYTHELERRRLS
ncbi:MAG: chloride channel protein [Rhizobiales bacterium]|nr:chloride channel protein [Hyphomicrobiales bacterium]MBI3674455.1 chloride channel protein [Hyphomicrobiales bacterium]